ncbi:hypothetical protein ID866_9754 [Astraeus odoratus]|nr:hypothetical protein ID866_9754 [Astraeus odoratus]
MASQVFYYLATTFDDNILISILKKSIELSSGNTRNRMVRTATETPERPQNLRNEPLELQEKPNYVWRKPPGEGRPKEDSRERARSGGVEVTEVAVEEAQRVALESRMVEAEPRDEGNKPTVLSLLAAVHSTEPKINHTSVLECPIISGLPETMVQYRCVFDIRGRSLKLETEKDVAPLLEGFDPKVIEEIYLGGNTIGVDASKAFAAFIEKTERLRIADLSSIFIGRLISEIPLALTALCNALIPKSTLVEIDLSDNAFGERSVDPLLPLLTHNHFEVLRLKNNGLGPAAGVRIADALRQSARLSKAEGKTSKLKKVICGQNRLENGSAAAWAAAFEEHGTLEEVRMPQNGIWMAGIRELARGLQKCPNLRYLDLQDNTFTDDTDEGLSAVQAWAVALERLPSLQTVNFSDCVLSHDGEVPSVLEKLAEGSNKKLADLQLQNNNLDSKSVELLANSISTHLSSLKRLDLQANDADEDDESYDTLREALTERGGRLLVTEEDEEEEKAALEQATGEAEQEEVPIPPTKVATNVDKEADALADLMNRVHIQ